MKTKFRILFVSVLLAFAPQIESRSQGSKTSFDNNLSDGTLRLDYIFSGTDKTCEIALDGLNSLKGWAGRKHNMKNVPLRGNGQICMKTLQGDTLYRMAFSTLFQEWQATEEATKVRKSFENVFLVPMPAHKVEITVELYDFWNNVAASLTHEVDPEDILIKPAGGYTKDDVSAILSGTVPNIRYVHYSGTPGEKIDVAIVAEGYTSEERNLFFRDAEQTVESLFSHQPFGKMKDRFNIIAVAPSSKDSGVSIPHENVWKNTAVSSHFDTFYSERYLTTLRLKNLHDILSGLPYEHIIILANTDNYGGGGVFNSYTLTTAHHKSFKPVVVHEFGHSFAGLADEYYYDDQFVEYYYPEIEPWEQNITTKADFASKWQDMVENGTAGLFEGGGYQSKGVWRPADNCRMKTNDAPAFCPVCQRAIESIIRFYTEPLD